MTPCRRKKNKSTATAAAAAGYIDNQYWIY
jgi:hypothetical protein